MQPRRSDAGAGPPLDFRDATAIATLARIARTIRRTGLQMVHRARMGHPGGDLSAADILAVLFFHVLRVDPASPRDPGRDRFILSKGHCSAALYAALAEAGFLPRGQLLDFMQPLSMLNGHPDRTKVPGVEANTGPLGHGLPIGVGTALAAKLDDASWRTFVLTGDGELQEGSNWEAAMAAAHFRLENLTVIVDRNGLQLGDTTERTIALEPLSDRWRAFGWAVAEVDGHDIAALAARLATLPLERGRPSCVIAHTHKGRGVSFMEDRAEWHHRVPTDEELAMALRELDGAAE
jgi:transketolase